MFEARTWKTFRSYEPLGQRVGVALSGGKDSLVALHLAHRYLPPSTELVVISIDEGIEGYRPTTLDEAKKHTEELGLEHVVKTFKEVYGVTLDEIVKVSSRCSGDKDPKAFSPCTYCGVLRRHLLNRSAHELGLDSLITGHTLDDETETILMNYLRGDLGHLMRGSPHPPKKPGFVPRVKPLREAPQKEVTLYALLTSLHPAYVECPYAHLAVRNQYRELLYNLESWDPGVRYSMLRAYDQIVKALRAYYPSPPLNRCHSCGEPTLHTLCRACTLLEKLHLGSQGAEA